MATLVKCKDCGKKISKKARKCPQCGSPVRKKSSGCGLIVIIIIGVSVLTWLGVSSDKNNSKTKSGNSTPSRYTPGRAAAYSSSKELVKKYLKSPSAAKFASINSTESWAIPFEGQIWHTGGYVDSQNSFGAMLRNDWQAYVEYLPDSESWRLCYLRLGDQEIGIDPGIIKKAKDEAVARLEKKEKEKMRLEKLRIAKEKAGREAREKLIADLKAKYAESFKPPVTGKLIKLRYKDGGSVSGELVEISATELTLKKGSASFSIRKSRMSPGSQARCYKEDYIKYMVKKKLAKLN